MTAKSRARYTKSSQKKQKLGSKLIGSAIAISLLLTLANMRQTLINFQHQQLIFVDADTFASDNYLPLEFGSPDKIKQQDFRRIDNLARQLPYSGISVTELAKLLEQHATTEAEKARIIYSWITQHISYDVTAFNNAINHNIYPDVSPEQVLLKRTTICSGFSNIYYALASAMNLESVIVFGYAQGATPEDDARFEETNHAWNAVKIDQGWYLLDATWGAGSISDNQFVPEFKPYYFATAPQEFINHHYPQDAGWQLLASRLTRREFDNLPRISDRFYSLDLKIVSHQDYQIAADNRIEIKLQAPSNVVALATMTQEGQELSESRVLVSRQGENLVINAAPPEVGIYDLTIYAKEIQDAKSYGEIIKYQITAANPVAELPKTYAHFHQYQASLVEPLVAELQPNWSTYFNLVVPQATDVQVVNSTTQEWIPLTGYGSYFAGNVDIQPGNISIVAKFPGDDQYWQLVEYQAQ